MAYHWHKTRYIVNLLFYQRPPFHGGKMGGSGGAAELLGMKRTSLYARMKKLDLSPKQWRSVFE